MCTQKHPVKSSERALPNATKGGGVPIDLGWFARYGLRRVDEILAVDKGVMGGKLDVLGRFGYTPAKSDC